MRANLKNVLMIAAAVLITFTATAAYYNKRVSKQVVSLMAAEGIRVEAFNDVYRVEAYDAVEDFIRRGCIKEALQLVQIQQIYLLTGIAEGMRLNEGVTKVVFDRSAAVAERARAQAAQRRLPDVPICK